MLRYLVGPVIVAVIAAACSSASIKINTTPPGADVYIKTVGSGERQQVGKTPIAAPSVSDLQKNYSGGAILIEIEKEDYQPASVLITEVGGSDIEVSQILRARTNDSVNGSSNVDIVDLNKGLEQIFEAQRLVRVGRLDDALKVLDEVQKAHPQIAPVHEMKGGIFYVRKDYSKALDEYRSAIKLNSENAAAREMIRKLETKYGVKDSAIESPVPSQTEPDKETSGS